MELHTHTILFTLSRTAERTLYINVHDAGCLGKNMFIRTGSMHNDHCEFQSLNQQCSTWIKLKNAGRKKINWSSTVLWTNVMKSQRHTFVQRIYVLCSGKCVASAGSNYSLVSALWLIAVCSVHHTSSDVLHLPHINEYHAIFCYHRKHLCVWGSRRKRPHRTHRITSHHGSWYVQCWQSTLTTEALRPPCCHDMIRVHNVPQPLHLTISDPSSLG